MLLAFFPAFPPHSNCKHDFVRHSFNVMMAKHNQHVLMEIKLVLWTEMCFHVQSSPKECNLLGCNGMLPLLSLEIT